MMTSWQYVQMCKLVLFVTLTNQVLHGRRIIAGLYREADLCAAWGAIWLKPHWDLITRRKTRHYLLPDVDFELYALAEDATALRQLTYSSKIYKFCDSSSPAIRDAEAIDSTGLLGLMCNYAIAEYGGDLMELPSSEPQLTATAQHNDGVLGAQLERYVNRLSELRGSSG